MNSEHTPTQADRETLEKLDDALGWLFDNEREEVIPIIVNARIEATRTAEAEAARLREELGEAMEAVRAAKEAADCILAPICENSGRWMIERPKDDAISDLHQDGVKIAFSAFQRLYDATDTEPLLTRHKESTQ